MLGDGHNDCASHRLTSFLELEGGNVMDDGKRGSSRNQDCVRNDEKLLTIGQRCKTWQESRKQKTESRRKKLDANGY